MFNLLQISVTIKILNVYSQDTVIEAHMEVVGKGTIDGILEVIEAITANSTTTQVEIVIGREVRLPGRTLINLHFGEVDLQIGNPSIPLMTPIKKMLLPQVCIQLGTRHYCVS